jgi:uncharacterized membrane protein
MKRLINTFILGAIAVIFLFDSIVYGSTGWSISGNINAWLNDSAWNMGMGVVITVGLFTHFAFGKYDKQ